MKISAINSFSGVKLRKPLFYSPVFKAKTDTFEKNTKNESRYELNLSSQELEKRTSDEYYSKIFFIGPDSKEYKSLKDGDKEALKHLVKSAIIMDKLYLKQDNEENLPFLEYLNKEISKGNKDAQLTKRLMNSQKSIIANDWQGNKVILSKGAKILPGKGFYPSDLTEDEFQKILIKMLENSQTEEVQNILSARTVVKRDGKGGLKAIDYTQEYKEEFNQIADELEKASKTSTDSDFNEFLLLQAKALRENDPMLDAQADIKWAQMENTPLEFTIIRENYDDLFTPTIMNNKKLKQLLDKNNIKPVSKDSLGIRTGIVNQQGNEALKLLKPHLANMAKLMPYSDKYEQNFTNNDVKQTMVDVDMIMGGGDCIKCDGGITIAENLPNADKLSLKLGGGKRNVYHRQVRFMHPNYVSEQVSAHRLLKPEYQDYYSIEGTHKLTMGHENGHSFGPKSDMSALGKYKHIIEENKADMVSIAMLNYLKDAGVYTEKEKNEIITCFVINNFIKTKPKFDKPHRVRSVMEMNYFIKDGAIKIDNNGIIDIDYEKAPKTAYKMLSEIIDIQLSKDIKKAEKFVNENFVWTKDMDKIAKIKSIDNKCLNIEVITPFKDYVLSEAK